MLVRLDDRFWPNSAAEANVQFWPSGAAGSRDEGVARPGKGANAEDDEEPNSLAEVTKSAERVVLLSLLLFGQWDVRDIFTPALCSQSIGHILC